MDSLKIPLVRWNYPDGSGTRIHVLDYDAHLAWTVCGLKVPPRTSRVYRSFEAIELVREYRVCLRCRKVAAEFRGNEVPHGRRRRPDAVTPPKVVQISLLPEG